MPSLPDEELDELLRWYSGWRRECDAHAPSVIPQAKRTALGILIEDYVYPALFYLPYRRSDAFYKQNRSQVISAISNYLLAPPNPIGRPRTVFEHVETAASILWIARHARDHIRIDLTAQPAQEYQETQDQYVPPQSTWPAGDMIRQLHQCLTAVVPAYADRFLVLSLLREVCEWDWNEITCALQHSAQPDGKLTISPEQGWYELTRHVPLSFWIETDWSTICAWFRNQTLSPTALRKWIEVPKKIVQQKWEQASACRDVLVYWPS
jgi:hypothetical protein